MAAVSIKGGVGKTSTVVNLADAAAHAGSRSLVWDLDPQGAATWSLGVGRRVPGGGRKLIQSEGALEGAISPSSTLGIDVLPADFSLRYLDLELTESKKGKNPIGRLIRQLENEYDVVLIDCPPGITLAIESVLHAVDTVLIPVVPTSLPLRTVAQLRSFILAEKALRHLPVLSFLSMIDRRRPTHRRILDDLPDDETGLLHTFIPLSVDIEAIGVHRRPVSRFAPRSKTVSAYRNLWCEIEGRL